MPGVAGKDAPAPSGQGVVGTDGRVTVLSTHDQILRGHTYLGCSFPSASHLAKEIVDSTRAVGEELAARGCLDHYGVDFVVGGDGKLWAIEVNLRHCGTTGPFMTLLALTNGTMNAAGDAFITDDGLRRWYVASDNVYVEPGVVAGADTSGSVGLLPCDLVDCVKNSGLGWNAHDQTGVVLHMLASASMHNKFGMTAVAESRDAAVAMFARAKEAVNAMAHEALVAKTEWDRVRLLQDIPGDFGFGQALTVDDDVIEFGVDAELSEDARKVVIVAATHGNEICGVLGINELIAEGYLHRACVDNNVALTVILGNPRATAEHKRFSEVNLNRCFVDSIEEAANAAAEDGETNVEGIDDGFYEHGRAAFIMGLLREIEPEIYIDLHSCSALSPAFALPMDTKASACLAGRLPVRVVVQGLAHATTAKGTSLDWMLTHMPEVKAVAVECGRHDARSSVDVAKGVVRAVVTGASGRDRFPGRRSLVVAGNETLATSMASDLVWLRTSTQAEFVPDEGFAWTCAVRPFQSVTKGDKLAKHGSETDPKTMVAKADGVLVMPTLLPVVGEEAYFLCQQTSGPVDWDGEPCLSTTVQPLSSTPTLTVPDIKNEPPAALDATSFPSLLKDNIDTSSGVLVT